MVLMQVPVSPLSVWSKLSDRHKRTMLVPLVLPEALVITLVVLPVGLHVGQQLGPTLRLEDLRDVRIFARRIAELFVRAVTVVGPESIVSDHVVGFIFCSRIPKSVNSPGV